MAGGGKEGDYQLGQDMVFFKASKGGMLAELMLIPKDEIASRIVEQSTKDVGLRDKELRRACSSSTLSNGRRSGRHQRSRLMEAAFLATVKLVQWMHWGEQRLKAKNAAAVQVQARRRARSRAAGWKGPAGRRRLRSARGGGAEGGAGGGDGRGEAPLRRRSRPAEEAAAATKRSPGGGGPLAGGSRPSVHAARGEGGGKGKGGGEAKARAEAPPRPRPSAGSRRAPPRLSRR